MTILALDTTSNFASIAVRADQKIVSEVTLESTDGFAHLIFPAIERCKNEANIELAQIDCFAAASGPGSFTGLRVGLSAVKGLAEATRKSAVGISNLRALSSFGQKCESLRAVVLDARRGEVYAGVYDQNLLPVLAETVGPLTEFLERLGALAQYEFIAPSSVLLPLPFTEAPKALAAAVALCAEQDGAQGKWLDPALIDANYVRRSDAELFWREN